ncbi:ankyrin repeat domain-containing protein [Thiobacillus sp. 65-1402]|uniref:ankyrin repeat domain-containing protein n=1 Tax=Thiobacillus sp. 65-1402 TaxID=1895861 RepID=UPI0025DC98BC|nr:ankyrin repeat domain-containing protein [Thiobacillus sp. 65-1402]
MKSRLKFSQSFSALAVLIAMGFTLHAIAGNILWDAISRNDMGKAKILITIGADVNQKNSIGNPILHHAVSSGNPELAKLLISKGADVNAKGRFDRVALHYANKKGMAKILLAHGANVDAPTNYGETPLHWAAEGINGLDKQVDLVEFAEVLIAHGADVNRKTGEGRSYATPLNYAVASNNLPVAKLLIVHGADVEGGGSSPLSAAVTVGMAQLLVDNGAGVNTRSSAGWYPLHSAANRANIKVTNYLLSRGANPNAVSGNGYTALYMAAGSDYGAAVTEALLSYGADLNAKNASGQTALHQAASQGATKVIEILLAHKADINAADNSGYVPLLGAISYGIKNGRKPVEVLVNNGANVNAESARGETPLGNAIRRGDIEVVKLLIGHGASVSSNKYGVSPLYLARDSKEIAELLKEHGAH